MDTNSIRICVRCRPWHPEKELPFVAQHVNQPFFISDGFTSPRRPMQQGSLREVVEVMDNRQLDFDKPDQDALTKKGQPGARRYKDKRYIFDQVFGMNATQEQVFEHTVKPLLPGVLGGFNATAFAYGATGCGKTHTISGDEANPGIIVRTIEELFRMKAEIEDDITMELSMVEIYNEEIRDLLSDNYPNGPLGGLKMLEKDGQMKIQNVTTKELGTVENVMDLVMLGTNRRSTSFTHSNAQSSRSHAVLQINIGRHTKNHDVDTEGGTISKESLFATLSIIDLAGSERASATQNQGKRMQEGAKINQSLLSLSNCIHALCQAAKSGGSPHIPYRNSKLTRMLKFSLGGNCRTVMIVCVSPSSKDIEDTHNTLLWANRAKEVKTTVSRNTAGQPVTARQYLQVIHEQSQRIKLLQAELEKADSIGPGPSQQPSFSKAKADAAAKDALAVLAAGKLQLGKVLQVIAHGAKQRALWDNAEMQISAYKRELAFVKQNDAGRPQDDVAKAVGVLEALIQRQQAMYISNEEITAAVQQEANATAGLRRMFSADEQRTFGDAIEKNDLVSYRTGLSGQRAELDSVVSTARESGYREAAVIQADALAKVVTLLQYFSASVEGELDMVSGIAQTVRGAEDLSAVASRLTGLGTTVRSQLTCLFNGRSAALLPPLPAFPQPDGTTSLAQMALKSPARPRSVPSASRSLGPPSRSTPKKADLAFKAMPAAQRLLGDAMSTGSPRKGVKAMGSPLRPALRKHFVVGSHKGRTPKKTARWKDEVGGTIDDRATAPDALVFSSPSDVSGADQGNNADWEEEDSTSPPAQSKIGPTALPKLVSMIPRASPPSKPANIIFDSAMMPPPPVTKPTTSTASTPAVPAPIPEWKKNRMMLGKSAGARLSPLGEERESSASPDKAIASIGLGAPSRLGRTALSERHDNPTSGPSPAGPSGGQSVAGNVSVSGVSSSFFANLARPTASSLAKAESKPSKLGAPSRRVSSIGPQRNRRLSSTAPYGQTQQRRSRGSIAPGDASLANMSIATLGAPSKPSASFPLAPGSLVAPLGPPIRQLSSIPSASRLESSPHSGASGASGASSRRNSYMPPPSGPAAMGLSGTGTSRLGGISGPRASISMASLARTGKPGLGPRPSISGLRPIAGGGENANSWR